MLGRSELCCAAAGSSVKRKLVKYSTPSVIVLIASPLLENFKQSGSAARYVCREAHTLGKFCLPGVPAAACAKPDLLDHLFSGDQQAGRHDQAQRLRGLEIEDR